MSMMASRVESELSATVRTCCSGSASGACDGDCTSEACAKAANAAAADDDCDAYVANEPAGEASDDDDAPLTNELELVVLRRRAPWLLLMPLRVPMPEEAVEVNEEAADELPLACFSSELVSRRCEHWPIASHRAG